MLETLRDYARRPAARRAGKARCAHAPPRLLSRVCRAGRTLSGRRPGATGMAGAPRPGARQPASGARLVRRDARTPPRRRCASADRSTVSGRIGVTRARGAGGVDVALAGDCRRPQARPPARKRCMQPARWPGGSATSSPREPCWNRRSRSAAQLKDLQREGAHPEQSGRRRHPSGGRRRRTDVSRAGGRASPVTGKSRRSRRACSTTSPRWPSTKDRLRERKGRFWSARLQLSRALGNRMEEATAMSHLGYIAQHAAISPGRADAARTRAGDRPGVRRPGVRTRGSAPPGGDRARSRRM